MKYEKKSILIVFIYTLFMLVICIASINALKNADNDFVPLSTDTHLINTGGTEIVYIPVYVESSVSENDKAEIIETSDAIALTVKSYEGKIGVFSKDGTLVRVVEVYVKTLPAKDRRLLEEGIEVNTEAELRGIIEDYTG